MTSTCGKGLTICGRVAVQGIRPGKFGVFTCKFSPTTMLDSRTASSSFARQQKSHVGPNLERRTCSKMGPCSDRRQLRDIGVDVQHCVIFEEEGITGDVLLEIDKETILLKELDFGRLGKRLKTWQLIRAFQKTSGRCEPNSVSQTSKEGSNHN